MKRFLTQIILFIFFLACTSFLLITFFYNDYSGNQLYRNKLNYFLKNKDSYNTLYMGSSRIYRQLNPAVIDSALSSYNIKSFNLAAPATFNPESYFLYENLINSNELKLKYAFIELHQLSVIAPRNITTAKNYYIADTDYLDFSFDYINASEQSLPKRIYHYITYSSSFLLRHFMIPAWKEISSDEITYPEKFNGYYSFSDELARSEEIDLLHRRKGFLRDTTVLINRARSAKAWFNKDKMESAEVNTAHLKMLNHLIDISKDKGIELYFIIPPRHEDYKELVGLIELLPNRVIQFADYSQYPKLYTASNSFDVGHLNESGSQLLSAYFADKFRSIIEINKE